MNWSRIQTTPLFQYFGLYRQSTCVVLFINFTWKCIKESIMEGKIEGYTNWSEFHIFFSFSCPPYLGSLLPYWSTGLIAQFLDLSQAVGLLGWVISSLQVLCLNTGQHKHRKTWTHIKHPCPGRDSDPQSPPLSDRRLFMPKTAWLPWPAWISCSVCKMGCFQGIQNSCCRETPSMYLVQEYFFLTKLLKVP
jgi:hypothetical protein